MSGNRQARQIGAPIMLCLTRARAQLYERIDARVDAMLEAGWVDEVERLLERGYDERAAGMKSLGYEEILSALRGSASLDDATAAIKRRSRQYAKRQMTWFRKDRRLRWLDADRLGRHGVVDRMLRQIKAMDEARWGRCSH